MTERFRRPGSMSDADRALTGRRTPAHGVPSAIDDDLTPPPQPPPRPEDVAGFDTREQVQIALEKIGELSEAVGKVWEARKDATRIDRVDSKLATLADAATKHTTLLEQFVLPALKDAMAATDALSSQLPAVLQKLETTSALLSAVDTRLRTMEVELKLTAAHLATTAREIESWREDHERRINEVTARIAELERKERDREVVTRALAKVERRKTGGLAALVGTVTAAIASAVAHIFK